VVSIHHREAPPAEQGAAAAGRQLTAVKVGNVLYLSASADGRAATPTEVIALLHPYLTYDKRKFLFGYQARDPQTGKKRRVELTEKRLYGTDQRGRLYTNFGFVRRVRDVLKQAGYGLTCVDWDAQQEAVQAARGQAHPRPLRYQPDWEHVLEHFQFRERQDVCLAAIMKSRQGLIHAVTGFGKMALIAMTCLLYPQAKIHIVTKRVPLVNKLVEFLTRSIPNVGQFGDGQKCFGDRITVFTAKSLGHSDFDADFLLVDEGHEVITDDTCPKLSRYQRSRNFTFTATPTGRTDGSDIRLEGYFGRRSSTCHTGKRWPWGWWCPSRCAGAMSSCPATRRPGMKTSSASAMGSGSTRRATTSLLAHFWNHPWTSSGWS
jgi:hypothetical protein